MKHRLLSFLHHISTIERSSQLTKENEINLQPSAPRDPRIVGEKGGTEGEKCDDGRGGMAMMMPPSGPTSSPGFIAKGSGTCIYATGVSHTYGQLHRQLDSFGE